METHSTEHPGASWPAAKEGGLVSLALNTYVDQRGTIRNLTEHTIGSVAVIFSKGNTERSNHWHRRDRHYLFTLSGRWMYQECAVGEDVTRVDPLYVEVGETVYTPPNRVHRCTFLEDTTLISMSELTRTHENHESDVVRLEKSNGKE